MMIEENDADIGQIKEDQDEEMGYAESLIQLGYFTLQYAPMESYGLLLHCILLRHRHVACPRSGGSGLCHIQKI